ncbi:fatty acid desaturase [Hyphomicrobiales bacterium]|nr:fatty acid desaturase [Hyphomicrobiales bacterium]
MQISKASGFNVCIWSRNLDLAEEERLIAGKFKGKTPWIMIAWWFLNLSVWLSLWPLTIAGSISIWSSFFIASICACLCYLPSHEAQHENIGKKGSSFFWLNELIGYTSLFIIALPYRLAKATHLLHHTFTNNPTKDPDYGVKGKSLLDALWINLFVNRQKDTPYLEFLEDSSEKKKILFEALVTRISHWLILVSFAWAGYGVEVLAIWWLPRLLGSSYLQMTLSWAPHHPMEEQGRYRDTRGFKAPIGTILTSGMEYHIIHHLHPSIPLNLNPQAYRALKPILEKRNCRLDGNL